MGMFDTVYIKDKEVFEGLNTGLENIDGFQTKDLGSQMDAYYLYKRKLFLVGDVCSNEIEGKTLFTKKLVTKRSLTFCSGFNRTIRVYSTGPVIRYTVPDSDEVKFRYPQHKIELTFVKGALKESDVILSESIFYVQQMLLREEAKLL